MKKDLVDVKIKNAYVSDVKKKGGIYQLVRVNIPIDRAEDLNITKEDKKIKLEIKNKKITIEKVDEKVEEE